MPKQYFIECDKCAHEVEFNEDDVPELSDAIAAAVTQAKNEVKREYEGMIDLGDLPVTAQMMKELATAIRNGDQGEAELILDRVAEEPGHSEAVQVGRFSMVSR